MARRVLTYELCKQIASKCNSISELQDSDQPVYYKCKKEGWLTKFIPKSKLRVLTYEVCKEIASTCKNVNELVKKDCSVYNKMRKEGWVHEFLPNTKCMSRGRKSITKELCKEIASTCKNCLELQKKDSTIYDKIRKMGWLDEFFPNRQKDHTIEEITEAAKKCKTSKEFKQKFGALYTSACHYKLLNTFNWLKKSCDGTNPVRDSHSIYVYEFNQTNDAYIGITLNKKQRQHSHAYSEKSPVYRKAKELCVSVPKPKYICTSISADKASKLEQVFIDMYRAIGWNMLNSQKGGNLGGAASVKWTYKVCIALAKNHTSLQTLRKEYPDAARKMYVKGWIKDCPWLVRRQLVSPGFYTNMSKEQAYCYAAFFKNRTQFEQKYPRLYIYAKENNWLDEWFPKTIPYSRMSKEQMYAIARTCTSREDFCKYYKGAYNIASDKGWLNEWFGNKHGTHAKRGFYSNMSKEQVYAIAKMYNTRHAFSKGAPGAYNKAVKNKWMDEWFSDSRRAVIAYKLDGVTILKKYVSLSEAARDLGASSGAICDCCKGHHTHVKGVIVRYAE